MLDTVKINHVQHISFTQSRLTDAVSVILSELLSYEHPPKSAGAFKQFLHILNMGFSYVKVFDYRSIGFFIQQADNINSQS